MNHPNKLRKWDHLGIVLGSVVAFLVFAVFVPGLVVWLVSLVK